MLCIAELSMVIPIAPSLENVGAASGPKLLSHHSLTQVIKLRDTGKGLLG